MVVPTLIDSDIKLFQSLAILEYLDEVYPEPPLLPADPLARAWVRGLALINVADCHPLIVPRVRHYLTDVLKVSDDQRLAWIQHWLGTGLQAMETLLAEHPASGRFCHGETSTVADICLVTQVTPAKTFNCALDPYPRVIRVYETCMAIPAFAAQFSPMILDMVATAGALVSISLMSSSQKDQIPEPFRGTSGQCSKAHLHSPCGAR
jgi:maleylacetoacetate isomerase